MYFIIPSKFLLPLNNVRLIVNVMVVKKTIDSLISSFSLISTSWLYIFPIFFWSFLLSMIFFGDLSVLLSIFFIRFNFFYCFHFNRIRIFNLKQFYLSQYQFLQIHLHQIFHIILHFDSKFASFVNLDC